MGIAFAGLVGVWAIIESDLIEDGDIRWLLPIPWVLAGIAGLLAITLPARSGTPPPAPAGWTRAMTCVRTTRRSERLEACAVSLVNQVALGYGKLPCPVRSSLVSQ